MVSSRQRIGLRTGCWSPPNLPKVRSTATWMQVRPLPKDVLMYLVRVVHLFGLYILRGSCVAAQGWTSSMLANQSDEFSSSRFADRFSQPKLSSLQPDQPGSGVQPADTVDYEYAISRAVRLAKIGITLRFDGLGRFSRVSRNNSIGSHLSQSGDPAGVWSIQRRHGDDGSITVILTLKWNDRVPEALLSDDGGSSFVSQAAVTDDVASLALRSNGVPSWFLPSSPQRRPSHMMNQLIGGALPAHSAFPRIMHPEPPRPSVQQHVRDPPCALPVA
jgi:hypothetical protein